MDRAAEKLGIGRDEIRRRNLIQPDAMPYTRPLASRADPSIVIDEANFPKCLETALEIGKWSDFPARQAAAAAEGRFIGIGLSVYLKGSGRGPSRRQRCASAHAGVSALPPACPPLAKAPEPCWRRLWRNPSAWVSKISTSSSATHRQSPMEWARPPAGRR